MKASEHRVIVALGSNLADRELFLRKAAESLSAIATSSLQKSKIFETQPMGPAPQGPYLNQCLRFSTRLAPRQLLEFCQDTEKKLGRKPRGKWAAREIDIDILVFGDELIDSEELKVPHPYISERQFVLRPLIDLDPECILPGQEQTVTEMLQQCIEAQGPDNIHEYRSTHPPSLFPDHIRHICIEGVIGVGKSTLVKILCERLNCSPLYEDVENNPFLSDFYGDKQRYAFQTQLFFFLSRYRQMQEMFQQQDLLRAQVVSDYMFAKDRIFASLNLDENEMALYGKLSEHLEKSIPKPDFVVYLQADTKTLLQRIRSRDRTFERNMDEAYIELLNQSYNTFFHYYKDSPLLIVNTNHIDFVKNPLDLDVLVQQILKAPPGVNYFSPAASF